MTSSRVAMSGQDYGGVWIKDEAAGAGVSWPAVFAGAFTMGALILILGVLGAGMGFSSVSPVGKRPRSDIAAFGGSDHLVDTRAACRLIHRWLSGRTAAYKMGFPAHPRDLFQGYGPWLHCLGRCSRDLDSAVHVIRNIIRGQADGDVNGERLRQLFRRYAVSHRPSRRGHNRSATAQ